jgi:hypothetical protein
MLKNSLLKEIRAQLGISVLWQADSRQPRVVEGYYDGDELSDRRAASCRRAILVRNYLQSLFTSIPNGVGTAALENRPPEGSSHTSWNGVAIVLLKVKR